jgi:hypothetical protein
MGDGINVFWLRRGEKIMDCGYFKESGDNRKIILDKRNKSKFWLRRRKQKKERS